MYDEQITLAKSLRKNTIYVNQYDPNLLYTTPRYLKREDIGITKVLPFQGSDIWNAYELSWLNEHGKPIVATAEIVVPCQSPYIVEPTSMTHYLNSFNNTRFDSYHQVGSSLHRDLCKAFGVFITIRLIVLTQTKPLKIDDHFSGVCLDNLDVTCDTYTPEPKYLITGKKNVTEILYSNLLRSNCLVSGQPDWGSVQISYKGKKIQHEGLLKYIISFRNHTESYENCVERIFTNILTQCCPEKLLVYARYTRRGGIDINPYRANFVVEDMANVRLYRQ